MNKTRIAQPDWARSVDGETAMIVSRFLFSGDWQPEPVEDERFLEQIGIELVELFMARNICENWEKKDYLEALEKLLFEFKNAWLQYPQWVNDTYAYGKQSVREFLEMNVWETRMVPELLHALFYMQNSFPKAKIFEALYGRQDTDKGYVDEKVEKFLSNPVKFWWAELDLVNRRRLENTLCQLARRQPWNKG